MLAAVEDRGRPEEGTVGEAGTRRVYPPHEVQLRLEVSPSGLRRLAGIYERSVGPLPRDERGRVWPEEAVEDLERARAAVREQRAVSIEAALRGQETPQGGAGDPERVNVPEAPFGGIRGGSGPAEAILEELRALRGLVEEQSVRIRELEEAVRTGRELPAAEEPSNVSPGPHEMAPGRLYEMAPGRPEASPEGSNPGEPPAGRETTPSRPEEARREGAGEEGPAHAGVEGEARVEGSPWRRLRSWIGV